MFRTEINARAVLRETKSVHGISNSASKYVCPSCQFAQRKGILYSAYPTAYSRRSNSSRTSRYQRTHVQTRLFSQATPARAVDQERQLSQSETGEFHFSIRPLANRKAESSQTLIRKSLRAWSEQNVQIKKESAPSEIPVAGRVTQLPNALFVKRHSDPSENVESGDTQAFGDHDEIVDSYIQPGSLFSHISANGGERNYAVYLGNVGVQAQLVLQKGIWLIERLHGARKYATGSKRAVIPNFLDAEEVRRLQNHLPQDQILRPGSNGEGGADISMRGPLNPEDVDFFLKRINKFAKDVDAFERTFGDALNAAYDKIAHETEWRMMSLKEYVWQALQFDLDKLDDAPRMAVVNLLNGKDYIRITSTAETLSVICYPKTTRANMVKVVQWAREYQDAAAQASFGKDVSGNLRANPLTSFIDKSRRLVLKSRRMRAPTKSGALGPCSTDSGNQRTTLFETGESFSEADKLIIDFIWTFAVRRPAALYLGPWRMQPITSLILRAVGAYPDLDLQKVAARLFLREIGCLDPWDTGAMTDLTLPIPGGQASAKADALFVEVDQTAADFASKAKELGETPLPDTMAHLRRDWGSHRVLTIDPKGSRMLEDAISVEQDAQRPHLYWLHVHVSHSTAFFDPKSTVGRYARHQGGAFYSFDGSRSYGLIPKPIAYHFSLKAGSPVLTISTLLGEDGSVHDIQVTPGTVRHVDSMNLGAVNQVLGVENIEDEDAVLIVGQVPSAVGDTIEAQELATAATYKAELELMQKLLESRFQHRRVEMPQVTSQPRLGFGTSIDTTTFAAEHAGRREHNSIYWKVDPGIKLVGRRVVERTASDETRKDNLVAQAMRLAAESAGSWLAQRKIPAVFLGTQTPPDARQTREGDRVSPDLFVRSSVPLPHKILNLKAYAMCTSPMRRYTDMLAQFQMNSYLIAEANGRIQPGASVNDESLLAFNKTAVDDYLKLDTYATDAIESVRRETRIDYSYQALFRAFHFKETQLPEVWEVIITERAKISSTGSRIRAKGSLVPFGLTCIIMDTPEGWVDQAGYRHFLPVKIQAVEPDLGQMFVVPAGPPSETQTMTAPMQLWSEANIDSKIQKKSYGRA